MCNYEALKGSLSFCWEVEIWINKAKISEILVYRKKGVRQNYNQGPIQQGLLLSVF